MIQFQDYQSVHKVVDGDTLYVDIANHCKDWNYFKVPGSQTSSAHEATHGINNQIRNANGVNYVVFYPPAARANPNRNLRYGMPLSFTNLAEDGKMYAGEKVNGFYLGYNRALVVKEPSCRKRDAIQYVPESLKGTRFGLYVSGQNEWDGQPLYLFDEWTAYINGAHTGIDLKKRNDLKDTHGILDGAIEFIPYGIAVAMAADKAGPLDDVLKAFTCFLVRRSFNVWYLSRGLGLPEFGEGKIIDSLLHDSDAHELRDFAKSKLDLTFPDKAVPDDVQALDDLGTFIWG